MNPLELLKTRHFLPPGPPGIHRPAPGTLGPTPRAGMDDAQEGTLQFPYPGMGPGGLR